MSAYDLTKMTEFTRIKKWLKIGSPTIYQNLKKLAAKQYLSTKTVKEGNMPEKVMYSITASGEDYFLKLMKHFSEHPGKIYFDFNAFIINLQFVDKETGLDMLHNLRRYFEKGQEDLDRDISELDNVSLAGKAIMKQYRLVFTGMIRWIEELIQEYEHE